MARKKAENTEIIELANANAAYCTDIGAVITWSAASSLTEGAKAPTKVYYEHPKDGKTEGVVARWGSNNLFPQERVTLIQKDTEIPRFLRITANLIAGTAVIPGEVVDYTDKGVAIMRPALDKVAEATKFCRDRNFNKWRLESALDIAYFSNTFPEMILNKGRDKIVGIYHQDATKCRLQEMNKDGKVMKCWINGDWARYDPKYTKVLPVIDTRLVNDVAALKDDRRGFSYIYVNQFPSPGSPYYAVPDHEGFFLSGWHDLSVAIPQFKKHMMQNQMHVKYHVEIDVDWWEKRHSGFWKLKPEKQKEIRQAELKVFNDLLKGHEKAGMAITTDILHGGVTGMEPYSAWKITPIRDLDKDGKYLEDSRETSLHKARAFGIDPAITGDGPGRDNASAGSGSDKWAAAKLALVFVAPMQEMHLNPVRFIFDYNGWTGMGVEPMTVNHPMLYTSTASELSELSANPARGSGEGD